jgi:hypothetical protein
VATQGSPDLQESTTKQNSTVCIIGVNKNAPNFVTLVAMDIYVVRRLRDKLAEFIQLLYRLSAVHCTWENPQGSIYIFFIVHYNIGTHRKSLTYCW